MNKEIERTDFEPQELIKNLMNTFFQRQDIHARQLEDGRYVCIKRPLTKDHLISHLKGQITLGTYVLNQQSQTRFIVFDADETLPYVQLTTVRNYLARDGWPSYLESSRRGGHLWIFFTQSISGKSAREIGHGLLRKFRIEKMELFPKQSKLEDGPGSLIRLPFGIHQKTGQRYDFISPLMEPLAPTILEQMRIMSNPARVDSERILRFIGTIPQKKIALPPLENQVHPEGSALSEKIKNSIPAFDFIRNYVNLSEAGYGKCPFHDDAVNSFAVNKEENYWHCFAGCGGGSIIDFWMKYRKCDFKTAVKELAGIIFSQN